MTDVVVSQAVLGLRQNITICQFRLPSSGCYQRFAPPLKRLSSRRESRVGSK